MQPTPRRWRFAARLMLAVRYFEAPFESFPAMPLGGPVMHTLCVFWLDG
jgi:hypothetical protein